MRTRTLFFVLLLALLPTLSRADFLYTVTSNVASSTSFSFTESALSSSGTVTTSDITQITGAPVVAFIWNMASPSICQLGPLNITYPSSGCGLVVFSSSADGRPFTPGSFLSLGTYDDTQNGGATGGGMTVAITQATAVPEPGSLLLLGSGLVAMAGVFRRNVRVKRMKNAIR